MRLKEMHKKELITRIIMTVAGVITTGIAVGFFSFAGLGLDPFNCGAHGLWSLTPLSYGLFYSIENAILLVIIFFWNRKKIGLGTVINLFLVGYFAQWSEMALHYFFPDDTLLTRIVVFIIAIIIVCIASAIYFTADMGVSTYDAIAITINERHPKLPFRFVRIATDVICVIIGVSLGAKAGIATVIIALFMGPLIEFFKHTISEPLLAWAQRETKDSVN